MFAFRNGPGLAQQAKAPAAPVIPTPVNPLPGVQPVPTTGNPTGPQ